MSGNNRPEHREKRLLSLIFGILLVTGALFVYLTIVPASDGIAFSKESGFYKKPFYLKIRAGEHTKIYYTLDGSEPDETATLYTEPVYIDNATNHENTISMREDVSAGFYTDLIAQYASNEDPEYVAPDFLIDKCTVLRVLAVGEDGKKTYAARTYFVEDRQSVPGGYVISIMTNPENLFDAANGIYVTGDVFEEELSLSAEEKMRWEIWDANYHQRGRAWERKAAIQIFDDGGKELINKTIGIRIHGYSTRGRLPKGWSLYARKSYDGEDRFFADLFGNGFMAKRLALESGGNQIINPLSDYLVQSRITSLQDVASKHYIPCELYLNGEYWGFYWLCEKYDEPYVNHYYGCAEEDVIVLKRGTEEDNPDAASFEDVQTYIRTHDMSDETCYARACEMIDMTSYIDYNAAMIFIGRTLDWPMSNYAVWRTKETGTAPYYDGKWRWMVFDLNSASMGYHGVEWDHPTLQGMVAGYFDDATELRVFASFWVNETFREAFKTRIMQIGATCFQPDEMEAFIDAYEETFLPYLEKSWARYYGKDNTKIEEYNESIAAKRDFFQKRNDILPWWFDDNIEEYARYCAGYTYETYLESYPPETE